MNGAKTNQPVSAFQALAARYLVVTTATLFTMSVAFALVPRQVFQSEPIVGISRLIIAHWPKLEADWYSLLRINPGFADKFVVSYAVLVGIAALILVICSLHLLMKAIRDGDVIAIRNGQQIRGVSMNPKHALLGVVLVLFCGWLSLHFPTPLWTKYPHSEMALIYGILPLSLLWMCLAVFAAAAISFFFGSHSKTTAKSDTSTARPRP